MRYWWVNHKQTFRHEFEGGYIWSPKLKRDGSRNRFYDFLRSVTPGDVVFSYSSGALQGAGFAISYCYTCPRPAEFGHIGDDGERNTAALERNRLLDLCAKAAVRSFSHHERNPLANLPVKQKLRPPKTT